MNRTDCQWHLTPFPFLHPSCPLVFLLEPFTDLTLPFFSSVTFLTLYDPNEPLHDLCCHHFSPGCSMRPLNTSLVS